MVFTSIVVGPVLVTGGSAVENSVLVSSPRDQKDYR